ncbi:hypothetical protein [Cesiribacter sp. SM1]|uniref:hypothetical protein n=1 Tax=Cesiribacter sp. SM1 TaxID=2861196 RepID=UPI001CD68270|nr:hypothetical protein [Cesiribacter sp. SM1]
MEASENKTKSSTEENIRKEDKQKLSPEEIKQGKALQQEEEEGENPFGGMNSRDFKKNLGCGG